MRFFHRASYSSCMLQVHLYALSGTLMENCSIKIYLTKNFLLFATFNVAKRFFGSKHVPPILDFSNRKSSLEQSEKMSLQAPSRTDSGKIKRKGSLFGDKSGSKNKVNPKQQQEVSGLSFRCGLKNIAATNLYDPINTSKGFFILSFDLFLFTFKYSNCEYSNETRLPYDSQITNP